MKYQHSNGTTTHSHLDQFFGYDGASEGLSDGARRQIMQTLRKACMVMGPGQKSLIGRIGSGAAIGALVASFSTPALAQYVAGGGSTTSTGAVAIGNGSTVADIQGIAFGQSNTSAGDGAIAIGNNNNVDTFSAPSTITQNQILDRTDGTSTLNYPSGATFVQPAAIGIGEANTVDAAGIAIGTRNEANNPTFVTIAMGIGNRANGGFATAMGVGNAATGGSTTAIGVANVASGNTAIALGRQNTASGQTSIALGNVSTANQTNAIAIGHSTQATAVGAIAIGGGTNGTSTNYDATAAEASGTNSVAIGTASMASGSTSFAGGSASIASGASSVALGNAASASTTYSIAIGESAVASTADNTTAIGRNASSTGLNGIALGLNSRQTNGGIAAGNDTAATGTVATSIGYRNSAAGALSTAVGASNTASGASSVAIGDGSTASGAQSIAIGKGNTVSGANSGAIGDPTTITGAGSYSLGNNNTIASDNAFAIGNNISITAGHNGSVGLGDGTTVGAPNSGAYTLNGGTVAATSPTSVVSVGSVTNRRQITNVAAGVVSATSTDAINGSQLFTTATALNNLGDTVETITGGGTVIAANGMLTTAPTMTVGGVAYHNVTAGVEANDAKATNIGDGLVASLGGSASVAADGTVTQPTYTIDGTDYDNVGDALSALAGSAGNGPLQYSNSATPTTANGGTATNDTTLVGAAAGPVGLHNVAAGATTAGSTDAINGGQINTLAASIATNTGGGSAYDPVTGTVSAPSIAVAGGTESNLTDAIEALDTANTNANTGLADALGGGAAVAADGTVTAPSYAVAGGTQDNVGDALAALDAGNLVKQTGGSPGSGEITVGATTLGTSVNFANSAGDNRVLTGVAAGTTTATSTDAVNGSQINTALGSVATSLGGGSTYDPVSGEVTAPSYTVAGGTQDNVGDALDALDAALGGGSIGLVQQTGGAPGAGQITVASATGGTSVSFAGTDGNRVLTDVADGAVTATSDDAVTGAQVFANNEDIADILGGGAAVDPATGALTGPAYDVGGTSHGDVGSALAALQSGAPVQYSTAAAPTTANGLNPSQNMTLVGAAAGPVTLSNVAPGVLTAASTDAVNGGQINALGSSIAANTGGGSMFDPATGEVTAPSISVGGTSHANITDAIEAGDAKADAGLQSTADALGGGASYDPATGAISAPTYTLSGNTFNDVGAALNSLANGTTGLVQQTGGAPGTGQITIGAATGGALLSVAGTDGNRVVSGLADGALSATSTDAVTGAQLFAITDAISSQIGLGGIFSPLDYTVEGNTFDTVAEALDAVDGAISGGGIKYFRTNSTMSENIPVGENAIAVGPVVGAAGTNAIAMGTGANVSGNNSLAIGTGNIVSGNGSGAIGDPNVVTGNESYALGNNNTIGADNAFVVGNNVTIAAGNNGSVALGNNSTVSAPNVGATSINGGTIAATAPVSVVSIGAPGSERQLTNVAAGVVSATSTDAINGSQLFAVGTAATRAATGLASALGGGAAAAPDGTITAPSYAVAGGTQNTVGAALSALDGAVTGLANGTSGIVQQTGSAPGSGTITVGGNTAGTLVNMAGTAGDRRVTGVAAPVAGNDAVNRAYADAQAAAGSARTDALGTSVAANLGGGAAYNATTGAVSAPSYTVGGRAYTDAGSALSATNRLAVQYVPDAAGAPTNAVRLTGNGSGAAVAVTNVAAGALSATSTDAVNGSQLFGVQQGAVNYATRPDGTVDRTIVNLGAVGAPTALRNVAAGVAPTDGVNLGQLQSGLAVVDQRIAGVAFDLSKVAKRAYAGTAAAMALQSPAFVEPGTYAMRGGMGYYRGQWALGLSVRATSDNGRWSVSGGISGGRNSGVAASAGVDFRFGDK